MFQVFPFRARSIYRARVCIRIFFNGSAKITAGNTGDKNCEVCRFTRYRRIREFVGRPPRPYKSVIGQKISENFRIYREGYRCIRKLYTTFTLRCFARGAPTCPFHRADASKFRRKCAKQIEDGSNFAKWKKEQVTFSLSKILLAAIRSNFVDFRRNLIESWVQQ